jgi:glycosyltransferase involved in cell wall biosynthesis
MALFEAMAAGVPIVATGVGGVPDVVGASEALLVPPEDPDALAAALRDTYDDPAAAAARAAAARRRLEADFGIEPWVARYEAIYQTVRRDC